MNVVKLTALIFGDINEFFGQLIKTIHRKQFSTPICVQFEQYKIKRYCQVINNFRQITYNLQLLYNIEQ